MKKSIKKNYLYNLTYQIVILLTPIITTPYISRVLGADGVGLYSYTYSIVSYFTLFAVLGTNTFGQREVAYYQDDKEKYSKAFWEVLIFRCLTGIISVAVYFIYLSRITDNYIIALMQGIYIIQVVLDVSWFFQGLEEFKKLVVRNLLVKLIYLIFIFGCIKTSEDVGLYILGLAVMNLLGSLSMWIYLPRYVCRISLRELHPFHNTKSIIQLFIPAIAIQIYTVLDKTMIGVYTETDFENGFYEQAEKLVKMSLAIVTSLGTVMVPRMAYTFESGDMEGVKKYLCKSYRFVWFMATPICIGLIAISNLIVPWFFGEGYEKCVILIGIFSFLVMAIGFSNITGVQYLVPTKRQNILTLSVVFGALINLTLNLILIPRYYSIGAAIASVCAETAITIFQFIYVVYIEKNVTWKDITLNFWKYLLSAIIMFIGIECLEKIFTLDTIMGTFAAIIIGALIYFACLILLKDTFFNEIVHFLTHKINKLKNGKSK